MLYLHLYQYSISVFVYIQCLSPQNRSNINRTSGLSTLFPRMEMFPCRFLHTDQWKILFHTQIYTIVQFFLRKNIYVVCRLRIYPLSKLRFRSTPGHLGNPLLGLLNKEALVLIFNFELITLLGFYQTLVRSLSGLVTD